MGLEWFGPVYSCVLSYSLIVYPLKEKQACYMYIKYLGQQAALGKQAVDLIVMV